MSVIGPVNFRCHEGSPVGKRNLRWEGFVEKVGFEPRVKEWWMTTVVMTIEMSWQVNESGSWFQRWGDAYLNEWSVIFNEEIVGGRESDNRWGAGTAGGLNRDQIVKIARLTGCNNFVGKRKKFIFNTFVDLKPVERSENGSDMWGFRSLNNSTSKRVLDLLEPVKLIIRKVVVERVTVIKFRMDNGGGNGAGYIIYFINNR